MASGPAFRLTRAAVFAAVCVVVTALGHALMSAHPLPGWAPAAAFCGTLPGGWWLAGRERGGTVLTAATVAAQLALHSLFSYAQHGGPGGRAPAVPHGHVGARTAHGGMPDPLAADAAAGAVPAAGHGSPGMLLAHVLAGLACGLWLWRGEVAAFRLVRALAAAVFVPLRVAARVLRVRAPLPVPARPGVPPVVRRPLGAPDPHTVSRRGPPGTSPSR